MAPSQPSSSEADEETQEIDPVSSPFSGMSLPCNGCADMGAWSGGDTVPLEDTLPLGEDEIEGLETQLLGGLPCLEGETQLLDDPECATAADVSLGGGEHMFRTQPMEACEETEVVGDDEEGSERTLLMCDEDGLCDDAATPCGDGCDDGGGRAEEGSMMGSLTLQPVLRFGERDKGEFPVAFEASTGSEDGSGPVRRSFTEVRAAALRASGLAAACSMTPRIFDTEQISSFCNNPYGEEQANITVSDLNAGMTERGAGLAKNREQFVDVRAGVLNLDVEVGNSDKCTQNGHREEISSKSGNLTARKLIFEEAVSGKDECTGKMMDNGSSDAPHSLVCNHSVAGLSYVDSQEPGEQTQVDALDAVDKFLSISDVRLSQEVNHEIPCRVKTPPISGAKGVHCLAKMGGHSSPVGKAGIFDWDDTLEDEGGGDFFSKKKDLFFVNRDHLKKSWTKTLKSGHCVSRLAMDAFDKIGNCEGADPETDLKTMDLTSSEAGLKQHNSVSSKLFASQVKTNNILCKEIAGWSNEEPAMQQSQKIHIRRGEESLYDVGPDTQMAAEAIEALICGPSPDHEPQNAHPGTGNPGTGNIVENSNVHATAKKASSRCISLKKRGTSFDIGGSVRQSKRIKMLHAEANLCGSNSTEESFSGSKMKRNLRKRAGMSSENGKSETLVGTLKSTKHKLLDGDPSRSFRAEKVHGKSGRSSRSVKVHVIRKRAFETGEMEVDDVAKPVVEGVSNGVDGCAGLLVSNDKISFTKELGQRKNNLDVTPIAHRTRKHNVFAVEKLGTVSMHEETAKDVEVKAVPAKRKQGRIVADAPEKISDRGNGSNLVEDHDKNMSGEFDVQNISTLPEMRHGINTLSGDALGYKKKRTARKSKYRNKHQAVDSNDPSLIRHVLPEAIVPCPIQEDASMVVENANVNLRSVKNKSNINAASLRSEPDRVRDGVRGALVATGVRTRSFIKSPPYTAERDSIQGFKGDISTGTHSYRIVQSTSYMNEKVHLQEVEPADSISFACVHAKHDSQLQPDVQDAQGNARFKGSPEEIVQPSGSSSMTPQKLNMGSPVCTSVDPQRESHKKGSSKSSVARELSRLLGTEAASILVSKDLRRRRDMASICVCLSHHLDDDIIKHQKKILARLGASIVTSVSDATHFIADKFVRTRNMLEAMAVGKPVVSHLWLESCGQASCFLDEKNYILRDARKEKEIGFSMPASLARARQRPLLQGKRVFITTNVKPDKELVVDLVRAAQGQPMERLGRSASKDDRVPDDLLVISCEEDFATCIPLLEKGAEVFSSELLLNGIVVQKLEYERHLLFSDHVKRTRSTIFLRNENNSRFLPVTKCT